MGKEDDQRRAGKGQCRGRDPRSQYGAEHTGQQIRAALQCAEAGALAMTQGRQLQAQLDRHESRLSLDKA